jgi:two-component system, OmpR family, response regulator MtrA
VAGHPGNVLVVEDDAVIRALYRAILGPRGHAITEVEAGEKALDAARASRPDVILLDIGLPGISGLDVLRLLKAQPDLAHVPVVIVTALDDHDTISAAMRDGAAAFMTKPFDPHDLTACLHGLLTNAGRRI